MKITLLMVGKTTDNYLIKLIENYQSRLRFYVPFEMVVIPELKNNRNLSMAEQCEKEADLILKLLESTDHVILLHDKGKQYSSVGFSDFLSKKLLGSYKRIVFVVGGSYGFSPKVLQYADALLSLSSMTFSHQMVRLIFVEQLYRAMTILKGEPYHHE